MFTQVHSAPGVQRHVLISLYSASLNSTEDYSWPSNHFRLRGARTDTSSESHVTRYEVWTPSRVLILAGGYLLSKSLDSLFGAALRYVKIRSSASTDICGALFISLFWSCGAQHELAAEPA